MTADFQFPQEKSKGHRNKINVTTEDLTLFINSVNEISTEKDKMSLLFAGILKVIVLAFFARTSSSDIPTRKLGMSSDQI